MRQPIYKIFAEEGVTDDGIEMVMNRCRDGECVLDIAYHRPDHGGGMMFIRTTPRRVANYIRRLKRTRPDLFAKKEVKDE